MLDLDDLTPRCYVLQLCPLKCDLAYCLDRNRFCRDRNCFVATAVPEKFLSDVKGCTGGNVACAADMDRNGVVDVGDLMEFLGAWGEDKCGACSSELGAR